MRAVTDSDRASDVRVRPAIAADRPAVANVLDAAALAVDHSRLAEIIDRGDVLVAVAGTGETTDRIVGVLVLEGRNITAVAVRRRRRDQGIGTAIVEEAANRRETLLAEFETDVRPFWESVGFAVTPRPASTRCRGVR